MENGEDSGEESEVMAFPIVFQEMGDTQKNKKNDKFRLPESYIKQLRALIPIRYDTVYPDFFKETWENGMHSVDNFFSLYRPLCYDFLEKLTVKKNCLQIVRLSSESIYIGEFLDGKCEGLSVVIFKNGDVYEGTMKDNNREGEGVYVQHNMGWFKGSFSSDMKTGHSIEICFDKSAYKGQFLSGLRNDHGLFVDIYNRVYNGQWKLGIIHGQGLLRTTGSTYRGTFVNALKHGKCEEIMANGDVYTGYYHNNRYDGFGSYVWNSGAIYEGGFKNGMRHGKGKWALKETKYSGGYVYGLKEGYGYLYFPSGNFYKGNFLADKREGYGYMFWTDGSFYKGEWKAGIQSGKGQIYLSGGYVISGLFENSILVQIIPTMYEKQKKIYEYVKQLEVEYRLKVTATTRQPIRNRIRVSESVRRNSNIKDNIYFRSPEKSPGHGHERYCKCVRRLEHFRLRNTQGRPKLNSTSAYPAHSYGH